MDYDLENLKLIAQGGEADIYDIGDNKRSEEHTSELQSQR